MAIPDYQSIMLPLLTMAGDGREHSETCDDLWGFSYDLHPDKSYQDILYVKPKRRFSTTLKQ
jgi:hypothetical protein